MRRLLVFQVLILFICAAVYTPALCMEWADKGHETIGTRDNQSPGLNPKAAQQNNDPTVYITNSGKKYHSGHCSCLKKSKIAIKLSEAKSQRYTACSRCNPPK